MGATALGALLRAYEYLRAFLLKAVHALCVGLTRLHHGVFIFSFEFGTGSFRDVCASPVCGNADVVYWTQSMVKGWMDA